MIRRLKHTVLMLMMFLVAGATSQAAVCDLACALQPHQANCRAENSAGMRRSMEMPGMPRAEPVAAWSGQNTVTVTRSCDPGVCRHRLASAVATGNTVGGDALTAQLAIIEVLPIARTLRGDYRATHIPSFRGNPVDPLLLSLRV